MDNVKFITTEDGRGNTVEHAIIERENGEMTVMFKSYYDEQLAKQQEKI